MLLKEIIDHPDEIIPCQYEAIKNSSFEAIINKYLQAAPSELNPQIIHMAGIPGAGKTTFYHSQKWAPHIFIAFDDIMEDIDEYQEDLKQYGTVYAFNKWEIPARVIGYELLCRAVSEKKNIFFDNGGSASAHIELMQNIKKYGYTTIMYYIHCPLETAIKRAQKREKEINRHIPVKTIEDRYYKTLENIKIYQNIVDKFYQIDTSDKQKSA